LGVLVPPPQALLLLVGEGQLPNLEEFAVGPGLPELRKASKLREVELGMQFGVEPELGIGAPVVG
jgi:hypothetical protein